MSTVKLPDDPLALPDDPEARAARKQDVWKVAIQLFVGIVGFCVVVFLASRHFRPELEWLSQLMIAKLGVAALFFGPFLADAFSVPMPPQLYLLAAITTHKPAWLTIALVSAGSVVGGNLGRWLGSRLGDRPVLRRLLGKTRGRVDGVFGRYGYWAVAVGSLMPLPYSILCYLAGVYRMPMGLFAVMSLLRIPRLVFFYYVLRAGFGT